jgi:hypothetical protein
MEDFTRGAYVLHVEFFTPIVTLPEFYELRHEVYLETTKIVQQTGVKLAPQFAKN